MEEWVNISITWFKSYTGSFKELNATQQQNFEYKINHSLRVAELCRSIAGKLEWEDERIQIAYLAGLFHDIGRFRQSAEYNTFNDDKSVDHGDLAAKILHEAPFFEKFDIVQKNLLLSAVQNHNKYKIQDGLTEDELQMARLVRDADKLDIFKVLAELYSNKKNQINNLFTSELPKGTNVSPLVIKEVLSEKIVSKKNVASELDMKIMQLSWAYDLNFRPSIDILIRNRYLEIIYNTLPKNDMIIDIYRKIKVFTENRILVKN